MPFYHAIDNPVCKICIWPITERSLYNCAGQWRPWLVHYKSWLYLTKKFQKPCILIRMFCIFHTYSELQVHSGLQYLHCQQKFHQCLRIHGITLHIYVLQLWASPLTRAQAVVHANLRVIKSLHCKKWHFESSMCKISCGPCDVYKPLQH